MSLFHVYQIRQVLHRLRQPEHSSTVDKLRTRLSELQYQHPFSLTPHDFSRLLSEIPALRKTEGPPGVSELGDSLFRFTPMRSLMVDPFLRWRNKYIPAARKDSDALKAFIKRHRSPSSWVPLSEFAEGHLSGLRGFTWWTTTPNLFQEKQNPIISALKLGIPADRVPEDAVLLRLPRAQDVDGRMHVPTCLDGFFSPIFFPTDTTNATDHGITLDLSRYPVIWEGLPEFTVGPIPVDSLEVRPVKCRASDRQITQAISGPSLYSSITSYLATFLPENEPLPYD